MYDTYPNFIKKICFWNIFTFNQYHLKVILKYGGGISFLIPNQMYQKEKLATG